MRSFFRGKAAYLLAAGALIVALTATGCAPRVAPTVGSPDAAAAGSGTSTSGDTQPAGSASQAPASQAPAAISLDSAPPPVAPAPMAPPPATPKPAPGGVLASKVVVVDPGHGGSKENGGATGVTGLQEKDANLAIGLALQQALENAGARVIMTRTTDDRPWIAGHPELDQLDARTYIAAHSGADLFISIHANWSPDPQLSGLETYYYPGNQQEARLANIMLRDISRATGMSANFAQGQNYAVLHNHPVPAVLLELGYVSNRRDEANLRNPAFRANVVRGVVTAARDYFAGF